MRDARRLACTSVAVSLIWVALNPAQGLGQARDDPSLLPALPARPIPTEGHVYVPPDLLSFSDPLALAERRRELEQWMLDYTRWKQWMAQWRSTREPGWFGTRPRRQKPLPPAWLSDACRDNWDSIGPLAHGCELLAEWDEDYDALLSKTRIVGERNAREAPIKTQWWEHVHFDGLWVMPQAATSAFAVVGIHATVEVAGRLQIFVAPGALLVNLPTTNGAREWQPAADWGISYRLGNFRFPGSQRGATFHLNLANAWILSGPIDLVKTSVTFAGLSVTLRQTP